jgi:hypothetical protein
MSCLEKWNFLFNFLTAFGTTGAVILALFGDFFKNLIFRSKIEVDIVDKKGELTKWFSNSLPSMPSSGSSGNSFESNKISNLGQSESEPSKTINPVPQSTSYPGISDQVSNFYSLNSTSKAVIYYHLKISNKRKSIEIKKCSVSLKEIYKKGPADIDFIKLPLNVPPKFFWAPASSAPQAVDIVTDQVLDFGYIVEGSNTFSPSIWPLFNNFKGDLHPNETFRYVLEITANNLSPKIVTIEVSWNGNWSLDLNSMANNFKICKI